MLREVVKSYATLTQVAHDCRRLSRARHTASRSIHPRIGLWCGTVFSLSLAFTLGTAYQRTRPAFTTGPLCVWGDTRNFSRHIYRNIRHPLHDHKALRPYCPEVGRYASDLHPPKIRHAVRVTWPLWLIKQYGTALSAGVASNDCFFG